MRALGDYYGLPIHYYLRVNFSGFTDIINTLGGVDVESDADFSSFGHNFHQGMNHMNGEEALAFVRNRYSFGEGDRARGRHQMAVIKGVVDGLRSSKVLTNYAELMDEMAGYLQTNASKKMIGDLVQLTLDRKRDWVVLTYSVDGRRHRVRLFSGRLRLCDGALSADPAIRTGAGHGHCFRRDHGSGPACE